MHSNKFYINEIKSLLLGLANLRYLKWSLIDDFLKRILTGIPSRQVCQITPHLFVGGQFYQRGVKELQKWGITSTISLREIPPDKFEQQAFQTLHIPTYDNKAPSLTKIIQGVDFINKQINKGGKIYIHCFFGVGRAPTMTAAFLISQGNDIDQAINKIKQVRPFIRITNAQYAQLQKYQKYLSQ